PSRPIRNLPKFHLMSPGNGELSPVSASYSGWRSGPLTCNLSNIGKLTSYLLEQNSLISSFVPGSCEPKSLQGKPSTLKPLSLYSRWSASRALYCGVSPHLEATFTTKSTLPSYDFKEVDLPSMSLSGICRRSPASTA